VTSGRDLRAAAKTVGALALLQGVALPLNAVVTSAALLAGAFRGVPGHDAPTKDRKTILISGGKMTKALQLARSFHQAGHRVVLVEMAKYRFTGHRFSRAVDAFHTVPAPTDPGYAEALLDIVEREGVDVYVPVCSPAASRHDAAAKAVLAGHCEVVHADPDVLVQLDDKDRFSALADSLDLPVPETHRITDAHQVAEFDFGRRDRAYLLKSIAYDPVNRLDLTALPRGSREETAAFARSKPISEANPWILQELVTGREWCTHSTVRDGRVRLHVCCPSSPFQVNYAPADKPEIEAWVRGLVEPLGLTGQVSLDFMENADGRVVAIECNPRTHSAITLFRDHSGVAAAFLDDDGPTVRPLPTVRPTYWLYHELWRLATGPGRLDRLRVIAAGSDAIFDRHDPLPFLLVHHLQIPSLLVRTLLTGSRWVRIDFNIGKLVEPAGD
jgi:hypothetical protein